MFNEHLLKLELPQMEEAILKEWKEKEVFKKSLEKNSNKNCFVFYEGPPTANGLPGIHHVLSRIMKDIMCRYKTMQGFYVPRKAGWDTHGLPVEIEVEKALGLKSKKDIESYGIEKFNQKCRESVFKYEGKWRELTERIGYFLDMDHPYITLHNEYIESVWWVLSEFFKKGFLYKGKRTVPLCTRCGTALSSHEVAQGYREVSDPSVFVRMKLQDENAYFVVWTTTPWTLVANVALAVNPELTYVKLTWNDEIYYLAQSRIDELEGDKKIISQHSGRELLNKKYEPLLDFNLLKSDERQKAYYVIGADFVSADDGSGIVHIAPAFGEDDARMGNVYNLPFLQPVKPDGTYEDQVPEWKGLFVKDADPKIIRHLKETKKLIKSSRYKHTYPFCWRCDTPLLYYVRDSWYIKTTAFKDDLLKANEKINWHPEYIKKGRFGEWLENNIDWAISRERYWGTPLNIWQCDSCEHIQSIANRNELGKLTQKNLADLDMHRPYVDDITFMCSKCSKGTMRRVPEVIDCWFDSGAMPVAQYFYPEHKDEFNNNFPAQYISEGIDQTRGWFYSLLAISTFLFKKSPYENCLVLGLVLDKNGQKMSKSKGNAVDPWKLIQTNGADTIRWYMFRVNNPWDNIKFDEASLTEIQWKFFVTLKNSLSFFTLYGNIDGLTIEKLELTKEFTPTNVHDRWILSRLHTLIKECVQSLDSYDINKAARSIESFVDALSNWYIRLNRRRFWKAKLPDDKIEAYKTLYVCLDSIAKLIAPFTPFWAEMMYRTLQGKQESVHLESFPVCNEKLINFELEKEMSFIERVVYLGRSIRNTHQLKVRQPLSELLVSVEHGDETHYTKLLEKFSFIIFEELNVKKINYSIDTSGLFDVEIKVNFSKLGPRFGKNIQKVKSLVENLPKDVCREFYSKGSVLITLDGKEEILSGDEIMFNRIARVGYATEKAEEITVALNTKLTPDLIDEGFAREMVNKVQFLRKELGFLVMDRIEIYYYSEDEVNRALEKHKDYISKETLAKKIVQTKDLLNAKETKLNEKTITIKLINLRGKDSV